MFVLCDLYGIIHNFEVYTGRIAPQKGPDLGPSCNIVIALSEVVPSNRNHLYCDNWFTSLQLQLELWKRGIFCLGTVRSNRLRGCKLLTEKESKAKGRGSYEKKCNIRGAIFRAIKWFDSKAVNLASLDSAEPNSSVKRYDRAAKSQVLLLHPNLVETYNKFMGGVDLLDSLIALYRNKPRPKKYYHRLFFHFLDVTVVTFWLLYRRVCLQTTSWLLRISKIRFYWCCQKKIKLCP